MAVLRLALDYGRRVRFRHIVTLVGHVGHFARGLSHVTRGLMIEASNRAVLMDKTKVVFADEQEKLVPNEELPSRSVPRLPPAPQRIRKFVEGNDVGRCGGPWLEQARPLAAQTRRSIR